MRNFGNKELMDKVFPTKSGRFAYIHIIIDSGYEWGKGWTKSSDEFGKEILAIFHENLGYKVCLGQFGSMSALSCMGEKLYIHPMEIAGVIAIDNISRVISVLNGAKSFRFIKADTTTDCCYDISEGEYVLGMMGHKELIKARMMELMAKVKCDTYDKLIWIYMMDEVAVVRREFYPIGKCSGSIEHLVLTEIAKEI